MLSCCENFCKNHCKKQLFPACKSKQLGDSVNFFRKPELEELKSRVGNFIGNNEIYFLGFHVKIGRQVIMN